MLITGRFTDYPLPLLLEIFLHRSETGVLEISSPSESGHIYFKDGKLIDAALGKQVGIEAVSFAETLTDSSFRFNSLPPAEYACLVWEKSLESRRNRPTDLHSRALAVYSGIRQSLVSTSTAFFRMEETLRSTAEALLAQANSAYERQKQATRTWLAVLQRRVGDWQTDLRAQQIQVPHERISNLIPLQQRERISAFVRNTAQLLSALNREPLRRNSFAVVTMALLGAMLLISVRQVELRRNQTPTSIAGNESGKLGIEFQTQPTPVLSGPAGLPNDSPRTSPVLTQKGNANEKGNLQRSTRKARENSRDSNITRGTTSLSQKKTLASPQPLANLADDSAGSKAQPAPTRAVQTISVVLQVEDGRVFQASLKERRPGMEGYEAAALRIARQRRYPAGAKRTDIVVVKVDNSHSN